MAARQSGILYVAPTNKSLAVFSYLCNDINIRGTITDVIFLAEAVDPDFEDRKLEFKEECESRIIYDLVVLPDNFVVDNEVLETFILYSEMADKHKAVTNETLYDALTSGLPKLPALRKVGVQTAIAEAGLNEDRFYFAREYVDEDGQGALSQSGDGKLMLAYSLLADVHHAHGVKVLFEAMKDITDLPFTYLALGSGPFDQLRYDLGALYTPMPSFAAMQIVGAKLTHLTLSVEDNAAGEGDSHFWRAFLSAATQLAGLRVYLDWAVDEDIWHSPQELGTMPSTLLPHITFPRLKTFEIIGKINQPTSVCAIWLNAFLTRHATSLRILEIHGVLLINWYNPWDIAAVMANALRNIGENLDLRAAEVTLHRRNEHANKACWGESHDGVLCDGTCTRYMSVGDSWIEVEEFEDLAQDLDVKLRDGKWDFGEFIMRH